MTSRFDRIAMRVLIVSRSALWTLWNGAILGFILNPSVSLSQSPIASGAAEVDPPSSFVTQAVHAMQPPPLQASDEQMTPSDSERGPEKPRRVRPGDDLVRDAAERLASHKTVQAMLRQQVQMFGQTLVGNGAYRQSRRGTELLLRMDMQLQLDDRAATYQQIADGRFLWKFQDRPDIKKLGAFKQSLTRVDLDVVRRSMPTGDSAALPPRPTAIGHGGLPQFLSELLHHFTFDVPQSATLHDVPVWILNGSWYEPALRKTMEKYRADVREAVDLPADFKELVESLPAQFPHRVSMAIGKDDLFPYRIEYRRATQSDSSNEIVVTSSSRPIVTLELFQVQYDVPIDRNHFVRRAGDLPVRDVTAEFLSARGLEYRR